MLDEVQVRRNKLEALQARGIDPYPKTTQRDTTCAFALEKFEQFSQEKKNITLAGRVMSIRVHGGMMFADVVDGTAQIQATFKEDEIGSEVFTLFRDSIDPGDIVETTGMLFTTKRGEKSLLVSAWNILSKALLPLPEKWHGLQDVEKRYRERELDILTNHEVRERFVMRSKLVSAMRDFLNERDFLEVETPILQPIPGGASARPFQTHHHALDMELYLRISPEMYLKRLIVGGLEKVYEIGRCFRNEGIDYSHNPEFTMIELYWAYADKVTFVSMLEELLTYCIRKTRGSLLITSEQGEIDFTGPWKRTTFKQSIIDACGIDIDEYQNEESLIAAVQEKGLKIDFTGCIGLGEVFDQLFKKTARQNFVQPIWVFDYPISLKPLANVSPEDPSKSASVQLVVRGAEIINAYYHELHDPIEQRRRLMEQQSLREAGSQDAQFLDEAFLRSLEHGMPPTCGMGIGIDRLAAMVVGVPSLKESIIFPTLRSEN
ncbi:lysine--tRNA ligase [Candidatus Uhrbacteria bacterium]|nr:lysine--tRNA ligase [Candidatus Uhrbacteria bacterium]